MYVYIYVCIYLIINIYIYNINNQHLEIPWFSAKHTQKSGCQMDLGQVAQAIMPMCHDSAFATLILKRGPKREQKTWKIPKTRPKALSSYVMLDIAWNRNPP